MRHVLHNTKHTCYIYIPDDKIHGANMEPTWVLSAPGGPHIGPMNFAIWDVMERTIGWINLADPATNIAASSDNVLIWYKQT